MRIGVWARGLSEKVGGVKEYIRLMCSALADSVPDSAELFLIHPLPKGTFGKGKKNVTEISFAAKGKMYNDFVQAPRIMNRLKLDAAWFPKNVIPYGIKATTFVTIHDLAYFFPEMKAYAWKDTLYMKRMIKGSCRRADRVVAISKNTADDLERIVGLDSNKIDIIYEAAAPKYSPIHDQDRLQKVAKEHSLPQKFILFTGGISPRKNIIRLTKAVSPILQKYKDWQLVVTGGKGWRNKEILKAMNEMEQVNVLGFVEDQDMPALYNLTDVYAYPSLYEGFGLPVLEAQACECPVVASNVSSIPEVAGDSVCYVNPKDVDDIRRGIEKVITNDSYRQELILSGQKNTLRFSWDKAAQELLDSMYNQVSLKQ